MSEEKVRQEPEVTKPSKKTSWKNVFITLLVATVVIQTGYLVYLNWVVPYALGRLSKEISNSPGFAALQDLSNQLNAPAPNEASPEGKGTAPPSSLDDATKQKFREEAKNLGEALGGKDTGDTMQQIVDLALQLGSVYDQALQQAEQPDHRNVPNALPKQPEAALPAAPQTPGGESNRLTVLTETDDAYTVTLNPAVAHADRVSVKLDGKDLVVTIENTQSGKKEVQRVQLDTPVNANTLNSTVKDGLVVITVKKAIPLTSDTTA